MDEWAILPDHWKAHIIPWCTSFQRHILRTTCKALARAVSTADAPLNDETYAKSMYASLTFPLYDWLGSAKISSFRLDLASWEGFVAWMVAPMEEDVPRMLQRMVHDRCIPMRFGSGDIHRRICLAIAESGNMDLPVFHYVQELFAQEQGNEEVDDIIHVAVEANRVDMARYLLRIYDLRDFEALSIDAFAISDEMAELLKSQKRFQCNNSFLYRFCIRMFPRREYYRRLLAVARVDALRLWEHMLNAISFETLKSMLEHGEVIWSRDELIVMTQTIQQRTMHPEQCDGRHCILCPVLRLLSK